MSCLALVSAAFHLPFNPLLQVFRAERKSDGYVVAIKRVDLELFGENMVSTL